jgi:hypothetical protein
MARKVMRQRTSRPKGSREEIGSAIHAAKAVGAEGLNVLASALLFNSRAFIFDRAAALRLPTVYQCPEMAEEGGLIGYGPLLVSSFRDTMSRQLAKLLRGAQPADFPVGPPAGFPKREATTAAYTRPPRLTPSRSLRTLSC